MIEFVIKIKDEKATLSEKDFTYEDFVMSRNNEELTNKVSQLLRKYRENYPEADESPTITVQSKLIW